MTATGDAAEARTTLELKGLEADNLLAFLALLGLLRALDVARPEWRARASWRGVLSDERLQSAAIVGRPFACLRVEEQDVNIENVATAVMDYRERVEPGLSDYRSRLHLIPKQVEVEGDEESQGNKKSKKVTLKPDQRVDQYRNLADNILGRSDRAQKNPTDSAARQEAVNVIKSLVRLVPSDKSSDRYDVEESPLQLPSGNMAFVETIRALFVETHRVEKKKGVETHIGVTKDQIVRSLSQPWQYAEKGASLRLSPQEDIRYALRFGDPSPEGASDERGATFLGVIGLLSFCLVPNGKRSGLAGYSGSLPQGMFSWPLWPCDVWLSHAAIMTMMHHPELIKETPDVRGLRSYGVARIMRCGRFVQNPETGNYGNVSQARAFL